MSSGRLRTNVKPTIYLVELSLDLTSETYQGKVTIDLDVIKETNDVSFNTANMDMLSITLGDVANDSEVQDPISKR